VKNISVVLVRPNGDANIGACARVMRNFGITDLRLVSPVPFKTKTAYMWAVSAGNILDTAHTYDFLEDALSDISYTAAFTKRFGSSRRRHMLLDAVAQKIINVSNVKTALMFGCERTGLTNDELKHANATVLIPTNNNALSLNLSHAVAIACYEIFGKRHMKNLDHNDVNDATLNFITNDDSADVIRSIDSMLTNLGYEDEMDYPIKSKISNQIKELFARAGLTHKDARMFKGLEARIRSRLKNKLE